MCMYVCVCVCVCVWGGGGSVCVQLSLTCLITAGCMWVPFSGQPAPVLIAVKVIMRAARGEKCKVRHVE